MMQMSHYTSGRDGDIPVKPPAVVAREQPKSTETADEATTKLETVAEPTAKRSDEEVQRKRPVKMRHPSSGRKGPAVLPKPEN